MCTKLLINSKIVVNNDPNQIGIKRVEMINAGKLLVLEAWCTINKVFYKVHNN